METVVSQVCWDQYWRLISSRYPPIALFEDIADPEDWELLCSAEARTNPRLVESIGQLDKVPVDRRANGNGASYVMAPFTHTSADNSGRFHDGHFGAFYAGNSFEVSLFETAYHMENFYIATKEKPGWISEMRELTGSIDAPLVDIRYGEYTNLLDKDDYRDSQDFARDLIKQGYDGVVYPSVRYPEGECFAAFYPDVMDIPKQGRHLVYHWNGNRIDKFRFLTGKQESYNVVID